MGKSNDKQTAGEQKENKNGTHIKEIKTKEQKKKQKKRELSQLLPC